MIAGWPIVQALDAWRFVNHAERLLTTGFATREGLERNADIIRDNARTRDIMRARYAEAFGSK